MPNPIIPRKIYMRRRCLDDIRRILGLPLVGITSRTGLDKNRVPFTGDMDDYGHIICKGGSGDRGPEYSSPSDFRDDLIEDTGDTYGRLFYQGKSLREHGISP